MDLQKFIHRQRVFISATLALLTGRQSAFVDKFSQLVVRNSTGTEATSSDAELSHWRKEDMDFA